MLKKIYSPITHEALLMAEQRVLPQAKDGDYAAIKELSMILFLAEEQGVPLPPELRSYRADIFRKIAEGDDPKTAFNIKRKRGGKDTQAPREKNVLLAAQVATLRSKNEGMTLESACTVIAASNHATLETVKKAWRNYQRNVELTEYGSILNFAKPKKEKG